MVQRLKGRDPLVGVKGDQASKEVHLELIESRRVVCHVHGLELGEGGLEVGQLEGVGPIILVRGAQHFKYFEDLVDFRVSHEEGLLLHHLGENAAGGPQIDTKGVGFLAEEDLRASVPEGHDLVRVSFDGEAKSAGKTEISQFDYRAAGIHKEVLGLEITMEDAVLVEVNQRLKDLVEERLGLLTGESLPASCAHILFQIELEVFKDQVKLVLGVDDFFQLNDVLVLGPL